MLMELLPFALALMAAGLIAGVLSGLLGVGGGIVIVPVLYHSFRAIGLPEEIMMHLAVGTSLATIIPTTIRSMHGHAKKGAVDYAVLRAWAPGIVMGVILGSIIADYVSGRVLMLIFAAMAIVFAVNLAVVKDTWHMGKEVPVKWGGGVMAAVMGVISTLMGYWWWHHGGDHADPVCHANYPRCGNRYGLWYGDRHSRHHWLHHWRVGAGRPAALFPGLCLVHRLCTDRACHRTGRTVRGALGPFP